MERERTYTFYVPCWVPVSVRARSWEEAGAIVSQQGEISGDPDNLEFANKEKGEVD